LKLRIERFPKAGFDHKGLNLLELSARGEKATRRFREVIVLRAAVQKMEEGKKRRKVIDLE
jgi:hypothetical protein